MKFNGKEITFLIAGIVTVALLVFVYQLTGNEEDSHQGSHGVFDHAETK